MAFGNRKIRQAKIPEGLTVGSFEFEKLLQAASDFCVRSLSFKDQSRSALSGKLRDRGYPESIVERAIAYMEECRYLDDRRLATAITEQLFSSGRGTAILVRRKLVKLGIERELIDEVIASSDSQTDHPRIISETLRRKFADFEPGKSEKKLADRVMRYFLSRGYSYSQLKDAYTILREEADS